MNGFLGKLKLKKSFGTQNSIDVQENGYNKHSPLTAIDFFSNDTEDLDTLSKNAHRTTSMAQTLEETFHDAVALSYFIQFMESVGQTSLVKFWLHVQSFRASASSMTPGDNALLEMIKSDASNIYSKYICVDAPCSIGLTESLRKRFLDDRYGRNLLEFVIAVETFNQELKKTTNAEQAVDDAIIIYDKYFSMQATNSLNFGDEIRVDVEAKICTEAGLPAEDAFDRSQKMAASILQQKFIPLFLTSQHFLKIVNELSTAIDNYLELPNPNKPRTSSEKSSDTSISLPSSNLSSEKRHSSTSSFSGSLKPDSRSRTVSFDRTTYSRSSTLNGDEDTPTSSRSMGTQGSHTPRRKLNSPLAKVDEYGRYQPLFDNSLKSEESTRESARDRLRNTLDDFLHKSAVKERLIADEVAELIISDIQKMVTVRKPGMPRKNRTT